MQKKDQIKLIVAVAILAVAGFCFYWFTIRSTAPEVPSASATPADTGAGTEPAPAPPSGGPRRVMPATPATPPGK